MASLSSSFAPSQLSSIASSLLPIPARPHVAGVASSMHAPSPGPATRPDKGKGRAGSLEPDQFMVSFGRQGFNDMRMSLLRLQGPVRDALSISSMENRPDAVVLVQHLQEVDKWFNFQLSLINKGEKSLDYCPPAATLPPYPTLGLAWVAMANNTNSIDLPTSKAIHVLVNSITVVNVNKDASKEKVPVPTLPGIRPPSQVAIQARANASSVMLSKVSIKDHPHHEQIVELAKELHAGEPKHLCKGKNTRDYLLQAKAVFEATQPSVSHGATSGQTGLGSSTTPGAKPKATFAQTVKTG